MHGVVQVKNVNMDLPHKYSNFSCYSPSHTSQDIQFTAPSLVANISCRRNKSGENDYF